MSKLRADSTWAKLSEKQREQLDIWLFEENLSYEEARERVEKDFGVKGTMQSLAAYYRQRAPEARMSRMLKSQQDLNDSIDLEWNFDTATAALLKWIIYEMLLQGTERVDITKLSMMMKMLAQREKQQENMARLELDAKMMLSKRELAAHRVLIQAKAKRGGNVDMEQISKLVGELESVFYGTPRSTDKTPPKKASGDATPPKNDALAKAPIAEEKPKE